MSYVPSGHWQAPPPPPAASGHPSANAPGHPSANVWWRIGHSWWVLLCIFGFGCLAGLGFLYVGLRARRPAWWVSGVGYLLVSWTGFLVVGSTEQASVAANVGVVLFMLSWLVSIVHACIVNSSWLRWKAGQLPWYAQPAASAPGCPGSPQPIGPPGSPPTMVEYGPPPYGPGSPVTAQPVQGRYEQPTSGASVAAYQPSSGPPGGAYPRPNPPTDPYLPPPVDPYDNPPLDPDLPPPVDPYHGPLPGSEASPPSNYYR